MRGSDAVIRALEKEGIKKATQEEIDTILKLSDKKLNELELSIDKEKLLYFSNIIKNRGH